MATVTWVDGVDYSATDTTAMKLTASETVVRVWLTTTVDAAAQVAFRRVGDTPWTRAHDLYVDTRAGREPGTVRTTGNSPWGNFKYPPQGRGLIAYLEPGQAYEVRVLHDSTLYTAPAITTLDWAAVLAGARTVDAPAAGTVIDEAWINANLNDSGGDRSSSEYIVIRDATFTGAAFGLDIDAERVIVHRCVFGDLDEHCIRVEDRVNRLLILENDFSRWNGRATGSTENPWGENLHACIFAGQYHAIDNLVIEGNRFGGANLGANVWDEWNEDVTVNDIGYHPEGPHCLMLTHGIPGFGSGRTTWYDMTLRADGTAQFGHCSFSRNVVENGFYTAWNDVISSVSSNFSLSSGMPGPAGEVCENTVIGFTADDTFEVEGANACTLVDGNCVLGRLGPWKKNITGTQSFLGISFIVDGPLFVTRNIAQRQDAPEYPDALQDNKFVKSPKDNVVAAEDSWLTGHYFYHNTFVSGSKHVEFFTNYLSPFRWLKMGNNIIKTLSHPLVEYSTGTGNVNEYFNNVLNTYNWGARTPANTNGTDDDAVFEADGYTPTGTLASGADMIDGAEIHGFNTHGIWQGATTPGAVRVTIPS